MTSKSARSSFYVTSGPVPLDAPCYVMRDADLDLHAALARGEFCYVLTSRHTGKSSLMLRTIARLREESAKAFPIDLESLGMNLTAEQWYRGFLDRVGVHLQLSDELEAYWYAHSSMGPLQRWMGAFREVVMGRTQAPVFIFLDGIDVTRRLAFSIDEFFSAVRGLYEERAQVQAPHRLSFCLLGLTATADLVQDSRNSPFPMGHRVVLTDFTEQEAQVLLPGLSRAGRHAPRLLERILYWTGGHPYLTQRLCQALMEDPRARTTGAVDRVCEQTFLSGKARETDDNLLFVRDRMLRGSANTVDLLTTYLNVWTGRMEKDDPANTALNELRVAGLLRSDGSYVRVRNAIYQRVFDQKFVEDSQPQDEVARQRKAERRGRMQVLAWATGLVGAFAALAISAWISRETTIEKNAEYAATANAGMSAISSIADKVYQLSDQHSELSSSYRAIVAAGDSFMDAMLKADPDNPAANNLRANRLEARIAEAIQAKNIFEARRQVQECLDRADELKDSSDIRLRSVAARLYATAAAGLGKMGESKQAEAHVQTSEDLARGIAAQVKPGDDFTRKNLSITYNVVGGAEAAMDHWERAAQSYRRIASVNPTTLDLSAEAGQGSPNFKAVRDALQTRNQEARADFESHNFEEARKILEEHSLSIARTLVKWNDDPSLKRSEAEKQQAAADLRDVKLQFGDVLAGRRSTWQEALKYYEEALAEGQKLEQADPSFSNVQKQEEATLAIARTRKLLGQNESALDAYNKYIALLHQRDIEHPTQDTIEKMGFAYHELANFEARHGTKSLAPADYQSAIDWLSKIAGNDPAAQRKLAGAHIRLADVESDFGRTAEAQDNYTKAARTSEKCVAFDLQHQGTQEDETESALLVDYENLAFGKLGMGDRKAAMDALAKLVDRAKAKAASAQALLDAKKTAETVDHAAIAYNVLSWAELLTNNPSESIRALSSVPPETKNQPWIQANLAHTYLLSGQFDQASTVYLAHVGEQMYDDRFEISVLDDLDELRKLGLDPPAIAKIEKLLPR